MSFKPTQAPQLESPVDPLRVWIKPVRKVLTDV